MVVEVSGIDLTGLIEAAIGVILLFIAYVGTLIKQKIDATHDIAATNKANIDAMNTAQSIQMVTASPAPAPVTVATEPTFYRYMTDAVKSFETTGWPPENKASFLAQVAFNEAARNIRYTVTIPGMGTATVENGCVIDTDLVEK